MQVNAGVSRSSPSIMSASGGGNGGDVESALADFSTRLRWVRGWQSAFFSLYCAVMAVSLALYLCLIRAVAR